MQSEGMREDRTEDEIVRQQMLSRWDFEELLAELRANPVLKGLNSRHPVIAKEYFAQA